VAAAPLDLIYRQRFLSLLELIDVYDGEVEVFRATIANGSPVIAGIGGSSKSGGSG
jgi:hypothetical protein